MSLTKNEHPRFAHPAEDEFAKILDYYGLTWQYEPHTFPLEWDSEGKLIEAFTPDFYLPEQELYIEITTLRPQLSNPKNRKLRRMKELYPEIQLKLLKRKEIRDLLVKYGLDQAAERFQGTDAQRDEP